MSFIGHNFHAQGIKDLPRALDHVRKTKPNWLVVMDGVETAKQFKDASPTTNVIVRLYMPDGFHYGRAPMAYLIEMRKQVGSADLWCYVENEAGIEAEWNTSLIAMNAMSANPLKLVILNLSVGTPKPEEWTSLPVLTLLKLASEYRQWCAIGLHEYMDITPLSGVIGGYPDNAGAQPNLNSKPGETGRDLVKPENWLSRDEIGNASKFHAGRAMWLVKACEDAKIPPPRIVLTEIGQDDLGDIEAWVMHRFGEKVRGFKSALEVWHKVYPDWSEDETYFNILKYLVEKTWASLPAIEGGCIFCYGHVDNRWEQFDVEGRKDFLRFIESFATQPPATIPELPAKPVPVPKPTIAGAGKDIRIIKEADVRTGYNSGYPSVDATPAAALQPDNTATLYTQTGRTDSNKGMTWAWIEIKSGLNAGKAGWVCTDWLEYEKITPAIQLPPKDDPTLGGLVKPIEEDLVDLRIVFKSIPRALAQRIQMSLEFSIVELVKETA